MRYFLGIFPNSTVVYSLGSWALVRQILQTGRVASSEARQAIQRNISGQKRKLFRIAWQSALCLLLNVIVTISTSFALAGWELSSDIWLRCSTLELIFSRDWDSYKVRTASANIVIVL